MESQTKKVLDQSNIASDMPEQSSPRIIRYGIGLDVHKDIAAVCVRAQLDSSLLIDIHNHDFKTTPRGLRELVAFLCRYHPVSHYLMECTGVYHLPIYFALQRAFPDEILKFVAMNPLMIKRRITDFGNKTDKIDAHNLATLSFYDALVRPSYVGNASFFQLRDLIRSYHKSQNYLNRLANRIHRTLHVANQKFLFNFATEWNIELLDRYISSGNSLLDAYIALIAEKKEAGEPTKVLENQINEIEPYGEIILTPEQRFLLQMNLSRFLQEQVVASVFLQRAESTILTDPDFTNAYQRLRMIPGFGTVTALTVLLELGDYRRFSNIKTFIKFCGLVPQINESAYAQTTGHINRCTNRNLRYVLFQAAGVIVNRPKSDMDLMIFAHRQRASRGKSYKLTCIKVAQKMTRITFHVLLGGIEYNPAHEQQVKKRKVMDQRLKKHNTLLESPRIRILKRDISKFFTTNYEYLNSQSRFHLVTGFQKIIKKATWDQKNLNTNEREN